MASNVQGIAITIKAFLPTGKTLDEQFEALSLVKTAHATSDYSALLKAATIDEVKTEQKVRRIEDAPAAQAENENGTETEDGGGDQPNEPESETDADVPDFLKKKKDRAA